jgi:DNA-3-methyladenine glycosylase II
MTLTIAPRQPFSFAETLQFAQSFPPLAAQVEVQDSAGSLAAALTLGGRAYAFKVRPARGGSLAIETQAPPRVHAELARRVTDWLGADDDLEAFYRCAKGDPAMQAVIAAHCGLRHVRFLGGLAEIAVYSVLMQRTPITLATRYLQRFLASFGFPARAGEREMRAMPELPTLATLAEPAIAEAIGHRAKAARIATVVREVAAIGEPFLREAPYANARDALLAIPGIGPFSAAAILLRGLGRMDELPCMDQFADHGRALYGRGWNPDSIVRRYGDQIGYWSFYLKARVPITRRKRVAPSRVALSSAP